jgi:hypothetical protein
MGIGDLRKEYLKLQKEFLGGPVGKLKAHEVEHRMAALKAAMAAKSEIPEPAPKRIGPPKAREVKTTKVALDEETEVIKPVAPKDGKVHATSYKKKAKTEESAPVEKPAPKPRKAPKVETEAAPAPAAEKPKKVRRVPPKVVLKEDESPKPTLAVEEKAAKPKPKPKSKATAAPKMDLAPEPEAPAPAPAPVVEKPVRLPGGCRALPASDLYLN